MDDRGTTAAGAIRKAFSKADEAGKALLLDGLRELLHREFSPRAEGQPIDLVRWVPLEQIQANDYNPNSVAEREMQLLYTSILHDGYTQPIVVVRSEDGKGFVIVDGFHRYHVCRTFADIRERTGGMVPVVVIEKGTNDRMASTIRHNRARGKHSVQGMSSMVFKMLENGWADEDICNELGMEAEELLRLKHITGFSKLFDDVEYSRAWVGRNQARLKGAPVPADPGMKKPIVRPKKKRGRAKK